MAAAAPVININFPGEIVVRMAERPVPAPQPETTQDRIKKVASCMLIAIGLALLVASFFTLGGNLVGILSVDPGLAQTLFLCGLAGTLGGFSLQHGHGQKGTLTLAPAGLPIQVKLEER